MDFELTEEHQQIREEVRRFGENEIEPVAQEHDVEEKYPYGVIEKAAEMGLLGASLPVEPLDRARLDSGASQVLWLPHCDWAQWVSAKNHRAVR
jgi:alkylation response protein AidB-like acyl-CoA dehydrogenase